MVDQRFVFTLFVAGAGNRLVGRHGKHCDDDACDTDNRSLFAENGSVVIEAVIDPNEPPLPGKSTTEQMIKFTESLARGEQDRFAIIKDA